MRNDARSNRDEWLVPEFERLYRNTWRVIVLCVVVIVSMAAAYLLTLNALFEWIAIFPAGIALFCLGYQGSMVKADNYIQDFASSVALTIEAWLSKKGSKKNGSIKSR
jgi:hypothetical protein